MNKKLTFSALMAVLGIICNLVPILLPSNDVFFYLFSTLFTYICTEEYGIKYGFLTFFVIFALSFIISPDKVSVLCFCALCGYYPVIKHIIEHLKLKKTTKWIVKLVFSLVVFAVCRFVIMYVFSVNINILMFLGVFLLVFVLYDISLSMGIIFYAIRIRKHK